MPKINDINCEFLNCFLTLYFYIYIIIKKINFIQKQYYLMDQINYSSSHSFLIVLARQVIILFYIIFIRVESMFQMFLLTDEARFH